MFNSIKIPLVPNFSIILLYSPEISLLNIHHAKFQVELEKLPAEKIKNICDTISSNDRRFIGEFEATHLQLADKIRKLILFPSIYVLDLKKYPLVCQKTHSEVLEAIKSQI